ncbi:Protein of unknown function [Cotesia congregata]|uniref:Uncharacterized protein n=1 Tax=Cotesia congregata TaxID=51543 RepID=A0A8J2HU72_COTCN|nr:Protein of unknown function [Cotesia congregata]
MLFIQDLLINTLIFSVISSVNSHLIQREQKLISSERSDKGVIIGPNTPVLYLTYPRPDFFKVNRIFEASPAYNYYHDPRKSEGVFFVRILVIVDPFLNKIWNLEDFIKNNLERWNKVDEYFAKLDNLKLKVIIAGVIVPEYVNDKSNFWYSLIKQTSHKSSLDKTKYYSASSTLLDIGKWLFNNTEYLDEISYDTFVFMSFLSLKDSKVSGELGVHHYFNSDVICEKDELLNFLQTRRGGLVYLNYEFSFNVVRMLTFELGGEVDASECGFGHIMSIGLKGTSETWSECSKYVFKKMNSGNKFNCLKM